MNGPIVPGVDVGPVRLHRCSLLDEARDEAFVEAAVHVDTLERLAGLAGGEAGRAQRDVRGALEVGGGGDDHRVVAAELEERRDEVPRGVLGDHAARSRRCR